VKISPPKYSKKDKKSEKKNLKASEKEMPDLAELERRIEQLAQELERAQSHQNCRECGSPMAAETSDSFLPPLNRPTPSKEKISFYTCNPFLDEKVNDRLVGI
jgi:uncharacterized small protein (DUF1192 family)